MMEEMQRKSRFRDNYTYIEIPYWQGDEENFPETLQK